MELHWIYNINENECRERERENECAYNRVTSWKERRRKKLPRMNEKNERNVGERQSGGAREPQSIWASANKSSEKCLWRVFFTSNLTFHNVAMCECVFKYNEEWRLENVEHCMLTTIWQCTQEEY